MQFPAQFPAEFPRPMPFSADPIAALFPAGAVGVDYDFALASALYLDTAMTQPVTAVGDPVAAIRNLRAGPHLIQASATKRALYARHPPQVRQLLRMTSAMASAAWGKYAGVTVVDGQPDPVGGNEASSFAFSGADLIGLIQTTPALAAGQYTFSLWLKGVAGETIRVKSPDASEENVVLTGDWQLYSVTGTVAAGAQVNVNINTWVFATARLLQVYAPQLEAGTTRTAYQRSAGAHDITEAGQRDIYGLRFDGVDDCYVTNGNLTLGTDEMCMLASVVKTSATPTLAAELSGNVNTESGSFYFAVPGDGTLYYTLAANGNAVFSAASNSYWTGAETLPASSVISARTKIATDYNLLRRNGVNGVAATSNFGSGIFNAYPLFIGARNQSSYFYNGFLDRLIITNRLPSDAVLQRAERYLGARAGVPVA